MSTKITDKKPANIHHESYKSVRIKFLSSILLAFTAFCASAQNNVIEEVAWVVGDQPIYKSEIEETYLQMLSQRMDLDGDPYCVIPEQLAIEKLFLHQAELDTITVQESMVQQQVESQINYLIANLGSKEKIEEYFHQPIGDYRRDIADQIRNQSRIQEVQRNITKGIKVTPADVGRYFNTLPEDSIPMIPMQVEVQIITLNPVIPREEIENIKARLRDFTDQINRGERDFSTLAILYSEDEGSRMRGGEIGFMSRGHLDPSYASVAFNLNDPKKVSKIVESEYGYHIIQLIEKRGERVNTRHILLRPKVSQSDLDLAVERLDSVRADIVAGKFTFEDATPYLSQDDDTRNSRGVMTNINPNTGSITTTFQMSELPAEIAAKVADLEPGEVSNAFIMKDTKKDRDIVAIVKLTNRIPAHRANMSQDYITIKDMYENSLKSQKIKDWIEKKIKDTYVRIEPGWDNCEFQHQGWLKLRK